MEKIVKAPAMSAVALMLLFLALAGLGQTASAQHLISSKAGFVNRVEGKVYIQRRDSEDGERGRASLGTQMRDGDQLITEADSRAEILLNPGSYLRLDEKTEVRAVNTVMAEARFEVIKGAAIVEVGTIDKKTPFEIVTPQGIVSIAKEGIYRFDVKGAATLVSVRKGELFLGTRDQLLAKTATKIGHDKFVRLTGTGTAAPQIAKLDQNTFDSFDEWSFQRAEMLVAANYSVLRRSRTSGALAYGWIYDPFYNCYTFIPGRGYLNSPYGFYFYRSFGDCSCYLPYYYPYYGSGPYYGGGGTTGGLRPSPVPRVTPGTSGGREPIHREIPSDRRVGTASPYSESQPSYGSHDSGGMGRSGGSVSPPASSGGGGRSMDTGGGAARGTGGGGGDGGARSVGGASPHVRP